EELGYDVEWDKSTKTITASNDTTTISLKIKSIYAEVNGESKLLSLAPSIVKGRTVVPLRFLSECSGATVTWDQEQKLIHITKVGKFDTGTAIFYEKTNDKGTLYIYNGDEINTISLGNKEIQNWYTYKGQVFMTLAEKGKENKGLYLLRSTDFLLLLDNFEIKDTFEYNDNLIILGYDRLNQFDKLCRFDGQAFYVIRDNFFVGKRFIFKDKLVISKYDNNRNYAVVAFDKSSWEPTVLKEGYIIGNFLSDNNYVYISGSEQEGTKKPLVVFDGLSKTAESFKVVLDNADVDVKNVVMFGGRLFAAINGQLSLIDNKVLNKVVFQDIGAKVQYNVNLINVFKNKLYIGMNAYTYYYDDDYKAINKPENMADNKGGVIELPFVSTSDAELIGNVNYVTINLGYKKLVQKFLPNEFRLDNDKLLMLGIDSETSDKVLYSYNGININKTVDILKINNTISVAANTFIDVRDRSRLTGAERSTMLLFNGSTLSNLVVDLETKKWTCIGGSLIFAGFESTTQRNKIYSFTSELKEQLGNFDFDYWETFDDNILVSGLNKDTGTYQLYKFHDENKVFLKDNIKINNILKAKDSFYFIDAVDKDPSSSMKDSRILYIYDDKLGEFIQMKFNIQLSSMLYIK
ncbi:MAG: copper amine oxidase N-terminal domain-containing protein, partial [Bacillota bacterium]|nr:copper amine oxidase N-terminal domain-containing protein [Bacillota bacterium]